jgi:outer membrane receptor for ferric coprogen and ferric-rhodotorulic acid
VNDEQEIGLKTEFFDRRVRFNIAGFYNVVTDKQMSILQGVPGSNTLLTILSNADQRDYGVEADLAIRVTQGLTLEASGSFLDAKLTKFLQPAALGSAVINDTTTDFVQYAPRTQFSVAGNYEHDFGSVKVNARVDYAWSASYYYGATSCAAYKPTPGCATALDPVIVRVSRSALPMTNTASRSGAATLPTIAVVRLAFMSAHSGSRAFQPVAILPRTG